MNGFTYSIKTMGCKANIYDSLILESELLALGGRQAHFNDACDLFLLNSCTVTEASDRESHRHVARARKEAPQAVTLVTGCFAQVGEEKLKKDSNVNIVVKNENRSQLREIVAKRFGIQNDAPALDTDVFWGQLPLARGKTRAFIKIQEGCNDFCTYCIIPMARGKSRSVPFEKIIAEIERLSGEGVKEVIFTGTNIADYGKDFGFCLEDLIEAVLKRISIPRLRLTSLDPTEITDRMLAMMGDGSALMPHFHVSLQSPVSKVLKVMKRHYTTNEVEKCLWKIFKKDSGIFVGMDLIAGFPTETADDHIDAVRILKDLPWTRLHVFPYSERSGTAATRLKQSVHLHLRKERAQELLSLSHERHGSFVGQFVGRRIDGVLFESPHQDGFDYFIVGHAPNYVRVVAKVEQPERLKNTVGAVIANTAVPEPKQDWTIEATLIPASLRAEPIGQTAPALHT